MNPVPDYPRPLKVAHTDPTASLQLVNRLSGYLRRLPPGRKIAVLCIGTDRSTGDSLGPLTGYALSKYHCPSFELFGTLEEPVHALNLEATLTRIRKEFDDPFVIAVDASLGHTGNIGQIKIDEGPLYPGAGVHKELPPVGDVHITAVVNVGGSMEYIILQNTRLNLVIRMANLIARSLYIAISRVCAADHSGT